MFPINKYRFYESGNKIVAVSTYAGKTVRGVAKCDTRDTFSQEKGQELAAARCELKVAKKRKERAQKKFNEAVAQRVRAVRHEWDMADYADTAIKDFDTAEKRVAELLTTM